MQNIPIVEARALYTTDLIDVYKSRPKPTGFLRSLGKEKESSSKYVSIEVSRAYEAIAVSVERGTEGNRNKMAASSNKTFEPPYFREYYDITELSHYDYMFGANSSSISSGTYGDFVDEAADKMGMLQDKIDRAYEKQWADVIQNGTIELLGVEETVLIDFKRKSESMVSLTGSDQWTSADPVISLKAGCIFLRTVGKAMDDTFICIMDDLSLQALIDSTEVQNRGKIYNYALDTLSPPIRKSTGYAIHGAISVGSWRVILATYPQYYDAPVFGAGGIITGYTSTPYIQPKTAILMPQNPEFVMGFGAVPQLVGPGMQPVKGKYLFGDYVDQRLSKHVFDIKSAGVAIPKAIDQIYTIGTIV
jgi:hypothetical protein